MGFQDGFGKGKKNFATEVVKVQISGPNRTEFSILDIPGIVNNSADMNEREKEGIYEMAMEYMRRPENIIM
jgi:hypothetical protein